MRHCCKKDADCKLECRAIQVFVSDAEADAPAVLTLYVVAKVFGQPWPVLNGRPCCRLPGASHFKGQSLSKGTNPTCSGLWPKVLANLSVWPFQPGAALLEMEPCPFLRLASMDLITANSASGSLLATEERSVDFPAASFRRTPERHECGLASNQTRCNIKNQVRVMVAWGQALYDMRPIDQ